jgi:uncharacterized damage-inducible protein DinB
MKKKVPGFTIVALALLTATIAGAQTQRTPPTPAQAIRGQFTNLNKEVLDMAKDFPAEKYNYRPGPDVRSFAEVMVHIASGNVYGAKAGRGEQVKWDELEPKDYATKDAVVALVEKSINDAAATLKAIPDEQFSRTLAPWMAVIEHEAEHFGQLVAYYRVNGIVPPESRPKTN